MSTSPSAEPRVLDQLDWQAREAAHHVLVDTWTGPRLERARRGEKHPVEDFLFTYYAFRPGQLRRWHPGADVVLLGSAARERLAWRWHVEREVVRDDGRRVRGVGVDVPAFLADRGPTVGLVSALLAATASRQPQLGCFGLHEWAMVYGLADGEQRHEDWPLRLGPAATDAVVESHPLRCSHFDAFRFFTPRARPRNAVQPSRSEQVMLEQPGCLHATMDLYRWSFQLLPVVPSSLVAETFALARDVRELDMRASPYDLRELGYEPVPIETAPGRAEYARQQKVFTERGQRLRAELLAVCRSLTAQEPVGSR